MPVSFYEPSAAQVAPALLGHWLIRRIDGQVLGGPIVETEAYLRDDPACHASRGQTPRTTVMFGPPGRAYVYFIYGCHFCVNAVCMPEGAAEAVLVRAIEPVLGLDQMRRLRAKAKSDHQLTNGPGKLCQALQIARSENRVDLTDPASPLFIARNPEAAVFRRSHGGMRTSRRIGITVAASLPLRFYLARHGHVSG